MRKVQTVDITGFLGYRPACHLSFETGKHANFDPRYPTEAHPKLQGSSLTDVSYDRKLEK